MVLGYVLITIAPTHEQDVFNKLSKVSDIIEIHPLFGEYDLIAKIDAEDYEKFGRIIINKIRSIEGIIDTKTLTGAKF